MENKTVIAVIDNGVTIDRVVRNQMIVENGHVQKIEPEHGFVSNMFSHGTDCALIIEKYCSEIVLDSIKILDDDGRGIIYKLQPALEWCIQNNIYLVNLSLGTTHFQDMATIRNVINNYANKGMVIVAASANSGKRTFPASLSNVIGVASGKVFGVDVDLQIQKGIDFIAPSDHELMLEGMSFKLDENNSYAAPYVTSMIGNLFMKDSCYNLRKIRAKLLPAKSNMNFLYYPDWIASAWVSDKCKRSDAVYYFKQVKGELAACETMIDTIVICTPEELAQYHNREKHIVYLGEEHMECPNTDKYFWSRKQRITQIITSKKRLSDIDIPFIVCKMDKKQDTMLWLSELRSCFGKDGYNVYAVSKDAESVLHNLEFLPAELCNEQNEEQIHDFLYWQTYYGQADAILLGVRDEFECDIYKTSVDMFLNVNGSGESVEVNVYCDETQTVEEIYGQVDCDVIYIIYQKIIKFLMGDADER